MSLCTVPFAIDYILHFIIVTVMEHDETDSPIVSFNERSGYPYNKLGGMTDGMGSR
ncbi:hypothetical protein J27TS7_56970 [Paenibacillus dendritiformis]|nr:hypothetical protein J27TS7_56970 [Paenibacillus dendritiformis]